MNKKVLSKKEWELLEILKQRKEINPERAEDFAVGIILVVGEVGNIDEVMDFCNKSPKADLTDILTFACKDLSEIEIVDNDDVE